MNLEKLVIPFVADTTQAKSGISKLNTAFKDFTGISMSTVGAVAAIGTAVQQTAQFLIDSNQQAIAYNNSMIDMARVTGMTNQEVQLLSRAADDARISQEALQKAMEMANKKGYETSIESLEKMAEEYFKLNTETEKAAFLTERFGKAGQEMGKLFVDGAEGLRKAVNEAKKLPTLTDAQSRALERERLAIDAVGDAWEAMKLQAGAATADITTAFANNLTNIIESNVEIAALSTRMEELRVVGVLTTGDINKLFKDMREGTLSVADAQAYLNTLTDKFYAPGELEKRKRFVENWNAMTNATDDNSEALIYEAKQLERVNLLMRDYNTQLLYVVASEGMSADAALDLASKLGLIDPATQAAVTQIETWQGMVDNGIITLPQFNTLVANMAAVIASLQDKKITITVKTVYQGMPYASGVPGPNSYRVTAPSLTTQPRQTNASGGSFMVPSGYPNDSFYLGANNWAQSGERVDIIPKKDVNKPVVAQIDEKSLARSIAEALMLAGVAN